MRARCVVINVGAWTKCSMVALHSPIVKAQTTTPHGSEEAPSVWGVTEVLGTRSEKESTSTRRDSLHVNTGL